jgi:hypothetical protein
MTKKERSRTVVCEIDETELENDEGYPVDGVVATCTKCGHETESFGTEAGSVRRCLALMREECPRGECNYYVAENGEDDY